MAPVVIYLMFASLLLNRGLVASISQCSSNGECENLPNCTTETCNYVFPSKVYCNVYYQGNNNTLHQFICSSGLLFDNIKLTCDYNVNVNCKNKTILEEATTTKFDVINENSSKSSSVYVSENTSISFKEDTETTEKQTSQYNVTTPATSQETESIDLANKTLHSFKCLSRFGLFPDPESCNYFYQCSHFKAYRLQCPSNLHFNTELQVCDWPEAAGCGNITSLETTMPSTTFTVKDFNNSSTHLSTNSVDTIKYSTLTSYSTSETDKDTSNTDIESNSQEQSTEKGTTIDDKEYIRNSTRESTPTNFETTAPNNATEISNHSSTENESTSTTVQDISSKNIVSKDELDRTKSSINPKFSTTVEMMSTLEEKQTTIANDTHSPTTNDDKMMSTTEGMLLTTNTSVVKNKIIETKTTDGKSTTDVTTLTEILPNKDERSKNFTCPSRFGLFPDPDSCNQFYQCSQYDAYLLQCPSNLHFNLVLQICDWPELAGCESATSLKSTIPSTTLELIDNNQNSTLKKLTTTGTSLKYSTQSPYSTASNETTRIMLKTDKHTLIPIIEYNQTTTSENFNLTTDLEKISEQQSTATTTYNTDFVSNPTREKLFTNTETTKTYNKTETTPSSTTVKEFTNMSTVDKDMLTEKSTITEDNLLNKLETTKSYTFTEDLTTVELLSTNEEKQITNVHNTPSHTFSDDETKSTVEGQNLTTYSLIGDSTITETQTTDLKSTRDDSVSTEIFPETKESFKTFACVSRYGLFPDPESCIYFYQCSHFKAYRLQCPSTLHFNPVLQVCDWPYAAGCKKASSSHPHFLK